MVCFKSMKVWSKLIQCITMFTMPLLILLDPKPGVDEKKTNSGSLNGNQIGKPKSASP